MRNVPTRYSLARTLLVTSMLIHALPALASFNLDYVATGRIWVPLLDVSPEGPLVSERVLGVTGLGSCESPVWEGRQELLSPRDHDCRFERQLGDALSRSGMFRRVVRAPLPHADVDLVVSIRRSRVQFRRQVIPAVKPFVVLTFFTYLWAPLPVEVDVESYDLRVAIFDRDGHPLSEVSVIREFTHHLSSYSAEQEAPDDLLARIHSSERNIEPVIVCRGPHAHLAVRELLQKLGAAVRTIESHSADMPDSVRKIGERR